MSIFKGALIAAGVALPTPAHATTVADELAGLAGTWQGGEAGVNSELFSSMRLSVTLSPAGNAVIADGYLSSGLDGKGLVEDQTWRFVLSSGQCFALTHTDGSPEDAFAVERAASGGLRFHRLTRTASEDQLVVRSEEITISKPATGGTRRLKFTRGEPLCRNGHGRESVCGRAETHTYRLHRQLLDTGSGQGLDGLP